MGGDSGDGRRLTIADALIPLVQSADTGPDWARRLERHGDAPALIAENGAVIGYRALLAMADAFTARLAPDGARRFVLLMVRNDVPSIAAYLGCLRGGHPVLLFDADGDASRIIADFAPDAVAWPREGRIAAQGCAGGLHPDLALLLSTSGSTGSPKLVRLSAAGLAANTAAIVQYLAIGPGERAVTTLAMHYSFGMSVVNSHLMAGAALIVTELSVTHPDFAALLARTAPTSISGVPYLFDLIERAGLAEKLPASLTTLTQAGGRMPADKLRGWVARGRARGFRFVAMYGQTEAGPRMAWLPPERAEAYPDCIGRAIPGGRFWLIDGEGAVIETPDVAGELVYAGPNVMMGYALGRADLALGSGPAELRTGDIAERNAAGLYRITGRASRFAKIAGLRIGFDDLEAALARAGIDAMVSGEDGLIAVQAETGDPARIATLVATSAQVPEAAVAVVIGPVPRLATGKPDYAAIRAAGAALVTARSAASAGVHPVLAGYRAAFNRPALDDSASFESLGGDSLSYVNVAMAVEAALGRLPARWEAMPIAALIAEAKAMPAAPPPAWREVGTETLVRLLALALVIIGHGAPDATLGLRGGATILFLMAGYNLARFQKPAFEAGRTWPALAGALERMILPYYLLMIPMLLASEAAKHWGWFALVSVFTVDDPARGPLFAFWFIESVFHALLVTILIFQLPVVRRASAALPFGLALALVAAGLQARLLVPRFIFDDANEISLTVDALYYLYALGWAAWVARGRGQQAVVVALALGLTLLDYGAASSRPWWLALALVALFALPSVALPRAVAGLVLRIASAGYFIYVAHVPVAHVVRHVLHIGGGPVVGIIVLLVTSIIAGLIFERVWLDGYARVTRLWRRKRSLD
jgi:acyl-CoA synthetase (AMP-forming)/AMP-acid ligase II